jgi:uncharacterized caspase-like protein
MLNLSKSRVGIGTAGLGIALALAFVSADVLAAERCALVIGVSDYEVFGKLDNPRQDHAEMVKTLRQLGFEVTERHNPNRQDLAGLVKDFAAAHRDAREAVFYYSGHGLQIQGRNYLTAVDSKMDVEKDLNELDASVLKGDSLLLAKEAHIRQKAEEGLLALDSLLANLDNLGTKNVARVVILDCCRDNPLGTKSLVAKSVLPAKGGLGRIEAPSGMLIAFAAREGKVALQTELGRPSLYTLLEQLRVPGLEVEQVFKRTRARVREVSNEEQEPAEYTNLTGNLVFNRSGAPLSEPPGSPAVPLAVMDQPLSSPPAATASPRDLPATGHFTLNEIYRDSPYAAYNDYSQKETLRAAQTKLKQMGHYSGGVDGAMGRGTQRAILDWQRASGLTVTGRLDTESLSALGLTGRALTYPPATKPRPRPRPSVTSPISPKTNKPQNTPSGFFKDLF